DVDVRGEVLADEAVVALLVAGRQADVLVEQEGAAAGEGEPVPAVAADELLVGGHRRGSRRQAEHGAGVPGRLQRAGEDVRDDLRARLGVRHDVDLHTVLPFCSGGPSGPGLSGPGLSGPGPSGPGPSAVP